MGRECRRVPADWQHPTDGDKGPIPLHEAHDLGKQIADWYLNQKLWVAGQHPAQLEPDPIWHYARSTRTYTEWHGAPPNPDDYMPDWPESERTHFQMYETTTEGTPMSPVFATPEELAHWLADHDANAFAGQTASYEAWLGVCREHGAPSAVLRFDGERRSMQSGVQAMHDMDMDEAGPSPSSS